MQNVKKLTNVAVNSPLGLTAQAGIAASAMTAVSMMSGGVGRAQDIMQQRYLRDSRYSSRLLAQTNIGKGMGRGKLNLGNHVGLSQSLHAGRHG